MWRKSLQIWRIDQSEELTKVKKKLANLKNWQKWRKVTNLKSWQKWRKVTNLKNWQKWRNRLQKWRKGYKSEELTRVKQKLKMWRRKLIFKCIYIGPKISKSEEKVTNLKNWQKWRNRLQIWRIDKSEELTKVKNCANVKKANFKMYIYRSKN